MTNYSQRFLVGVGLIAAAVLVFAYGVVSHWPAPYTPSAPVPDTLGIGVNLPLLVWAGLKQAAIPGVLSFLGALFIVQELERKRGDKVG